MLEGLLAPVFCTSPHPGAQLPPHLTTRLARTHLRRIPASQDVAVALLAFWGSVPLPGLKGPKVKERQDSQAVRGRGPKHHVGTDPTCPK